MEEMGVGCVSQIDWYPQYHCEVRVQGVELVKALVDDGMLEIWVYRFKKAFTFLFEISMCLNLLNAAWYWNLCNVV